jgi:GTP pyrophosphokinase
VAPISDLCDQARTYLDRRQVEAIYRAYLLGAEAHRGQQRATGDPYITHPVEVARVLVGMRLDTESVIAGMLHDVMEDTSIGKERIARDFGKDVAHLVDGVTKLSQIEAASRDVVQAENYRKMLLAMTDDVRVMLVKLADRLHNMRTIDALPTDRRRRIARETLEIYAPIAIRLGLNHVKEELEDLGFRALYPNRYRVIQGELRRTRGNRKRAVKNVQTAIRRRLRQEGLAARVLGREKHIYSVYRKMRAKRLPLEQVLDVYGIRILVDSVDMCYRVLGSVHNLYKPRPGRFKDYIALAKPNMYQSLHTTVLGPNARRIEIQIRTHDMHRVAEEGIASHWRYKEGKALQVTDIQRFTWLTQLLEWQQNLSNPQEFLHSLKEDLFPGEVYVFTPNGDLQVFPKGATVVDFAYRIHSDIGQHCSGARVNGRLAPFKYILRSGDTVEIITTEEQTPSRDWLKVAKTPRAKSRIRTWITSQQRERSVALGREILEGDFARHKLDYQHLQQEGRIDKLGQELGVKNEEGLLASVGYGKLMPRQVLAKLLPAEQLKGDKKQLEGGLERLFRLVGSRDRGVRVKGIEDVLVRFARCCHPLPGEEIAGIITRGRGVTVHVASCPTGLEADPERRVEVSWSEDAQMPRAVKIEVSCADKPGLLAAISSAISDSGVNIARAHIRTFDDKAVNTFEIMIGSSDQLRQVLQDISNVKGVYQANRVQG